MAPKRRKSGNGRSRKRRKKAMPVVIMKRRRHVSQSGRMIAKSTVRTLIYHDVKNLDSTGPPIWQVMLANSLFDPDFTGGGHQPLGFDQMMLLYNKYSVISCGITLTFNIQPSAAVTASAIVVGVRKGDSSGSLLSSFGHIVECRRVKYKTVQYAEGGNNQRTIKYGMRPPRFLGFKGSQSDADLWGTAITSPAKPARFEIFAAAVDNATNVPLVAVQIRMAFKTRFFEPETELVQS